MRADMLKTKRRERRAKGIRKRLFGTAERPRLSVFRSLKHIYAQIIDDEKGVTVCEASSRSKELRGKFKHGGDRTAAKVVGELLAERAKSHQVEAVQFDRSGYRYGGRIAALANAAREGGLKF